MLYDGLYLSQVNTTTVGVRCRGVIGGASSMMFLSKKRRSLGGTYDKGIEEVPIEEG